MVAGVPRCRSVPEGSRRCCRGREGRRSSGSQLFLATEYGRAHAPGPVGAQHLKGLDRYPWMTRDGRPDHPRIMLRERLEFLRGGIGVGRPAAEIGPCPTG